MKYKPHKYQMEAIEQVISKPCHALWLDPGEGKTSVMLSSMEILKQKKLIKGVLVVGTMKIVDMEVWPKEIKKWRFNLSHTTLHGPKKDFNIREKSDIYIINYEGLPWLLRNIKYLKADVIIFDESSKIKSFRTTRFKIVKAIISYFKRRYELTGTPQPKNAIDLFSQLYALDNGERLGRYITQYRNQYFYPSGYKGYDYQLQDDGFERIQKKIKDVVYRTPEDYLKIPKEKYHDIVVELNKDVMKQYKLFEEEFFLQLENKVITAINAGAKTSKLRQLANGVIYDEFKQPVHVHDSKLEIAIDIVEELQGSPVLIGYEFRSDLHQLMKAFPDAPFIGTTLDGVKPNKNKLLSIEKAWNAGELPVLIGQMTSIAHGLNLQEAGHNMLLYSNVYDLEVLIQFIARLRRQGQKKRVIVHRIIAKDTIDEDIIEIQNKKATNQNALLESMRKRLRSEK